MKTNRWNAKKCNRAAMEETGQLTDPSVLSSERSGLKWRAYSGPPQLHAIVTEIIELPRRLPLLSGAPSGCYQIGVPSLSRKTKVSLPRVTSRAKMVSTPSNCTLVPTTVTSSPLLNTRS